MFTADIDIGGTFTDGFFTRGAEVRTSKVLTTPHDLTECFINCLRDGASLFDQSLKDLLRQTLVVRLSTTLGTNTLIQRRGPKIGLIVTAGHERDLYGSGEAAALGVIVPADMVIGVREGVVGAGGPVTEPDAAEVLAAVRQLVSRGARMIAVSFAGSWRDPAHELAVRHIVQDRYPEHYLRSIPLQLGHEVSAAADNHARTNTVALNAYLHGELARGLYRAEDLARTNSMMHPLLVVHAGGGCGRVAKTVAVQTLSSGPAVAIHGTAVLARHMGMARVVTADMGGTSLDIAVVDGEQLPYTSAPEIEGMRLALPMIDTVSIGAGGGSIARVDEGQIRVGPESAGSAPGPACYDRGGSAPTVTDANVLLGLIDPDRFLGGRMKLNPQRAEDAIARRLGRQLNRPVMELAAEIRERVNSAMAADIKERLDEQGKDAAEFTLFAFGGGGPLHGCDMAERVGIKRVVGFPFGSVFSAFGSSTVDVVHDYRRSVLVALEAADAGSQAASTLSSLRRQALLDMRGEGFAEDQVAFDLELLVVTNGVEHRLPWPAESADGGLNLAAVRRAILEKLGAKPGQPLELRGLSLRARAAVPHWLPEAKDAEPHRASATGQRDVVWSAGASATETSLYTLGGLKPGAHLEGPAIVEAPDTSYAIPANWRAHLDRWGNVVMERR